MTHFSVIFHASWMYGHESHWLLCRLSRFLLLIHAPVSTVPPLYHDSIIQSLSFRRFYSQRPISQHIITHSITRGTSSVTVRTGLLSVIQFEDPFRKRKKEEIWLQKGLLFISLCFYPGIWSLLWVFGGRMLQGDDL